MFLINSITENCSQKTKFENSQTNSTASNQWNQIEFKNANLKWIQKVKIN